MSLRTGTSKTMANKCTDRCRAQCAPQTLLVVRGALREVPAEKGSVLFEKFLNKTAQHYALKPSLLSALIRQTANLHTEGAPHHLEICEKELLKKRCRRLFTSKKQQKKREKYCGH